MMKFHAEVTATDGSTRAVVAVGFTFADLEALENEMTVELDTSQPAPEGVALPGGPVLFLFAAENDRAMLKRLQDAGVVDADTPVLLPPGAIGDAGD